MESPNFGYQFGYVTGRVITKVVKYATSGGLIYKGCRNLGKVAAAHKIDRSDASNITENIFKCLKYID